MTDAAPPPPRELLILAGGQGTRLRSVVSDVPKPLAPIGDRPFLEHLMDHWIGEGIERFVLSIGHLAERIRRHFGGRYRNLPVEYVEEGEPLGTGGAVALAVREVSWRGSSIAICNGDTWFGASLSQLAADAARTASAMAVALVRVERNERYGAVRVDDDGRVVAFAPADGRPGLVSAGAYVCDVSSLRPEIDAMPRRFSLETDLLTGLARRGLLAASVHQVPFIDIGVPDDYRRFCRERGQA